MSMLAHAATTAPQTPLAEELHTPAAFELIGESHATARLRLQIDRIGPHFRTVLLHGEIGTGKELVARALHARSGLPASAFFTCYAAALSEVAGLSPSSSPWKPLHEGLDATIFLDGVEGLSLHAQSQLLEVLSGWKVSRLQTRLIATAGQDLRRQLATGRFRADLYHRLATIEITLEPLRNRHDDIHALAHYFLRRFCDLYDKKIHRVAEEALLQMQRHSWPGNVRELENMIRNAVLMCSGDALEQQHLPPLPAERATPHQQLAAHRPHGEASTASNEIESLQQVVERHVLHVLDLCGGNKVRAAEVLGISRSTLYRMLDTAAVTNGGLYSA